MFLSVHSGIAQMAVKQERMCGRMTAMEEQTSSGILPLWSYSEILFLQSILACWVILQSTAIYILIYELVRPPTDMKIKMSLSGWTVKNVSNALLFANLSDLLAIFFLTIIEKVLYISQIQFLWIESIEVKLFRHKQSESNFKYISHLSLPSVRFQR